MKTPLFLLGAALATVLWKGPNAIDRLRTDAEVAAFWGKTLRFTPPLRFEHFRAGSRFARTADSLGARDWWKTDLDRNGETDLLLFRREGGTELTFALAQQGTYRVVQPAYANKYGFLSYPVVKQHAGRSLIYLYHQQQRESDPPVIGGPVWYTPLACDTLVYHAGHVLNYSARPRAHRVEQVIVENNGSCEGNCPKTVVTIDAQRLTSTALQQVGEQGKRYRGTVPPATIKALVEVLNYANFPQLAPAYRVPQFDETTTTLTVVYDGGKRKVIRDYGSVGTCTLAVVYRLATDIKWEWVPKP